MPQQDQKKGFWITQPLMKMWCYLSAIACYSRSDLNRQSTPPSDFTKKNKKNKVQY